MSRARRVLARSGLALGSVLVTLLAAEGVARAIGFGAPPPPSHNGRLEFVDVDDPSLLFVNRADCSYESIYPYADGREPLRVRGSTNSQGFRGPAVPLERGRALRIACIGDSYTFGEGVEDDRTWPAQLADELARLRPGLEFEVMNCGVNAYDTRQEVRALETRVLPYAPDLVVLAFFLNDAAIRDAGEFAGHEYGRPSALYSVLTTSAPVRWLRDRSRLADGLADRIVRYEYLVFLGESRSRMYSEDSPGWRSARLELARANELCAERGAGFVVVLYPLLFRRGEHLATHAAYRTVAEACRAAGIDVLDLEPAFEGEDVDRLRVHPLDSHPNAAGHRIAARAIAEHLLAAGLVE
ncbi:MAG TPA: SGNH/GDSL hydrolase family protein [Planctomycetota bacterium]|nr:SGNH/GDSL hydrolase family protein [Planctomycetota bacterium]